MLNRTFLSAVAVAHLLTACGEGSTGSVTPSTQKQLTLVSSSPQANETGVNITSEIRLVINEPLNPDSVNGQNVHLMPGLAHGAGHSEEDDDDDSVASGTVMDEMMNMMVVEGEVFYESDTKTIVFKPKQHLERGMSYHIRVHNLKDSSGRSFNGEQVINFSFTTRQSLPLERIRYANDGVTVRSRRTYDYDSRGALLSRKDYDGDGVLLRSMAYDIQLEGGRQATRVRYDDAGEITSYSYDMMENGEVYAHVNFTESGDGVWGDDNDLANIWSDHNHGHASSHTALTHEINKRYTLPRGGSPILWPATQAERLNQFNLFRAELRESDDMGQVQRHIAYSNLGDNGDIDFNSSNEPVVIDDIIRTYHLYDYDSEGRRLRRWQFRGSDSVTLQLTETDPIDEINIYSYTDHGHREKIITYDSAGDDGDWTTVDSGQSIKRIRNYVLVAGTDDLDYREQFRIRNNQQVLEERVTYISF